MRSTRRPSTSTAGASGSRSRTPASLRGRRRGRRDLARLGLLHLQDGRWAGRRFLSRRWTRFAHTPAPTAPHYGGFWWINSGQEAFPSLPSDAYYASGAFGQAAIVVPSHDLVIARMGWNVPDDDAALDLFARLVLDAVERGRG